MNRNVSMEEIWLTLKGTGVLNFLSSPGKNISKDKMAIINSEIENACEELAKKVDEKLSFFSKLDKRKQNQLVAKSNGIKIIDLINSPNYELLFKEHNKKVALESLKTLMKGIEHILLNRINPKLKELNLDIQISEDEVNRSLNMISSLIAFS